MNTQIGPKQIEAFERDGFTTIDRFIDGNEIAELLAGIDGIHMWHDQTLQKAPWANATSWHMDDPEWSFHSYQSVTIWVALDPVTIQNGCLYSLPGSHKVTRRDLDSATTGSDMPDLFDIYPELKNVEAVPMELKKGGAGVHNSMIAPAAGPNMTPYWRRAMTCSYMPVGATFNGLQHVLSVERAGSMRVGEVLDDEEMVPLVWSNESVTA